MTQRPVTYTHNRNSLTLKIFWQKFCTGSRFGDHPGRSIQVNPVPLGLDRRPSST